MPSYHTASGHSFRKSILVRLFFSGALGLLLGFGFTPFAIRCVGWVQKIGWIDRHFSPPTLFGAFYLFLSFLLAFSVRNPEKTAKRYLAASLSNPFRGHLKTTVQVGALVFTTALLLGTLFNSAHTAWSQLLWLCFGVATAEELLFRGWLTRLIQWWGPDTVLFATNPIRLSTLCSALAFACWHAQNGGPWMWLALQMMTTFFLGLLFSEILDRTGSLFFPIVAHASVNLAYSFPALMRLVHAF